VKNLLQKIKHVVPEFMRTGNICEMLFEAKKYQVQNSRLGQAKFNSVFWYKLRWSFKLLLWVFKQVLRKLISKFHRWGICNKKNQGQYCSLAGSACAIFPVRNKVLSQCWKYWISKSIFKTWGKHWTWPKYAQGI